MDWLALVGLSAGLFWVGMVIERRRSWPWELTLGRGQNVEDGGAVVAIVPARDEAAVLPQTLPSLLEQQDGELRVLVVDDGSQDGTGEVATEIAAARQRTDRLRLISTDSRPDGWSGKVWALQCGVEALEQTADPATWLLFTDADIRHPPDSVGALRAKATEGEYDMVSVMARLHARSVWERLLIPPFVYFFQLLYPFRMVRRPTSKVAAAAGGCVLLRRAMLERAGGLERIKGAIIDDVSLARILKDAGGRLWLGLDPAIASVRPYRSLGELWRMVSRSAFDQLRYRYDVLLLVVFGLAVLFVSPPLVILGVTIRGAVQAGGAGTLSTALALGGAVTAWILQARALCPSVRHHGVPFGYVLTLPAASALYALMTLSSAWNHLTGRGASWKGRRYSVSSPPL